MVLNYDKKEEILQFIPQIFWNSLDGYDLCKDLKKIKTGDYIKYILEGTPTIFNGGTVIKIHEPFIRIRCWSNNVIMDLNYLDIYVFYKKRKNMSKRNFMVTLLDKLEGGDWFFSKK